MLEYLLKKFKGYEDTCPVTDLKDGCVTFIRNEHYANFLYNTNKDVCVIAPQHMGRVFNKTPKCVKGFCLDDSEFMFTLYHNYVHKNTLVKGPTIGDGCVIHPTVILNVEGLKVANGPDGSKLQFVHTGNIVIGDNVEIGPYSVIHRGTMSSTIIQGGVKIGAKNNIGHNNNIGKNTVFASGAITNGSVSIGENCWVSSGSLIRNGITICPNTVLGLGSVVVKDIINPGIYAGNPAKFLRPVEEGWNF